MENKIGENIKYLRSTYHLSQSKLASQLGVTQRTISYYESGERIPPADVLDKIATIFKTSTDSLMGRKKIGAETKNCENYFYEPGSANWNIRKKAQTLNISYEDMLEKTCIEQKRFDAIWYNSAQPVAEELIRFSKVLNVSIDYLLDESQRETLSSDEELILLYYSKFPSEIMDLLESYCSLDRKQRRIVLGQSCQFQNDNEESVAADEPLKEAK